VDTLAELVANFARAAQAYSSAAAFADLAALLARGDPDEPHAAPSDVDTGNSKALTEIYGESGSNAGATITHTITKQGSYALARAEVIGTGNDLAIALVQHGHTAAAKEVYLGVALAGNDKVREFESRWPALESEVKTAATLSAVKPDEDKGTGGAGSTRKRQSRKGVGGKPRLSKEEEQRRLEILSDWVQAQSADVAGKDFCRDKGIKLKELRAFVDWDSTRRKRGTNSG
jgi:hypothetical protein